jgi:Lysyl oxidase
MDAGATRRIGLAALVAASAVLAATGLVIWADAAQSREPGDPLAPDLVVQRPAELYLAGGRKETRLRVSNTVANRGVGPLEFQSGGPVDECNHPGKAEGRLTLQNVYEDSANPGSPGYFLRDQDPGFEQVPAGCSRYHPQHDHWHFDNFARYTLLDDDTGKVVGGSRKVSFCVLDTGRPYPGLDGSPVEPYFPRDEEGKASTCSETSIDGLSVGWEDTYGANLRGQAIKVTDLRRGAYCLVLETDPPTSESDTDGALAESDETNNRRTIRLRLRVNRMVVKRLGPDCRAL